MFALDQKLQERLRPKIATVLILEDNPNYARLLTDMFRMLGSVNIVVERNDLRALEVAEQLNPQIIITEFLSPEINGIEFTYRLRRSALPAYNAPVIMIKGDITVTHLKQARNAGVHEVMRKPFAWQDLLTRLRIVLFKPREWVTSAVYVGPDRRRFNTGGDYTGARKRRGEAHNTAQVAIEGALRKVRVALDTSDSTTDALHRSVMEQMAVIVPNAKHIIVPEFVPTLGRLIAEIRSGTLTAAGIYPIIADLMKQLNMPEKTRPDWSQRVLEEKAEGDIFLLDGDGKTSNRAA